MSDLIEKFMRKAESDAANDSIQLSENTVKAYKTVCDTHFRKFMEEEGIESVEDVGQIDIDEFVEVYLAQRVSGSSLKSYYNHLRPLFNHLDRRGYIEENPMDGTEWEQYRIDTSPVKTDSEDDPVYIEPEEKESLIEHVGGHKIRNRLIIQLMWDTGVRSSGLTNIKIEHIDRDDQSIYLPKESNKSKTSRTVWYTEESAFLLDLWLDRGYRDSFLHSSESPYLILSERNEQLSTRSLRDVVVGAAENAGIQTVSDEGYAQITPHVLRHSYAVQKARSGMQIKQLADLMGHSSTNTTEKYMKLAEKDLRQAAMEHSEDISIPE